MGGVIKPLLAEADPPGRTILSVLEHAFTGAVAEVWIAASAETAPPIRAAATAAVTIDPGSGPASALAHAAAEVRAPWILLCGGDQPHARPEVLDRLAAARVPGRSAVAARLDGRRQPLLALYERRAILELASRRALGGTSLQALLDALGVEVIEADAWPAESKRAFRGVNTPEEARAEGLVRR